MQESLELLEQSRMRTFERLVQGHQKPRQQAILAARRVGNYAGRNVIVELPQEIPYERRLPTPNFPCDYSKAGAVHHAKFEHGERQSVILAPVDQIRIRQD